MRADVEQQRLVGGVEDAASARRHRADGVAVIAVLQRDDASGAARRRLRQGSRAPSSSATSTAVEPLSEKKTCAEPVGRDRDQLLGQTLGGLMRKAGEDHLIEAISPAP